MDPINGNRVDSFTRRGPFPRRSILISAAVATIGLPGCGPDATGLKATAGEVTQDARGLGGSWMLVRAPLALGAIKSDGTGGACLMVAMREVPGYERMRCTGADPVCSPSPHDIAPPPLDNGDPSREGRVTKPWIISCDLPPGAAAYRAGQCWGWPISRRDTEKQACNRSIDYPPTPKTKVWTPGVDNPVNFEPFKLANIPGLAKPSHWRIFACVRDHSGTPFVSKCAWGPIKEVQ